MGRSLRCVKVGVAGECLARVVARKIAREGRRAVGRSRNFKCDDKSWQSSGDFVRWGDAFLPAHTAGRAVLFFTAH